MYCPVPSPHKWPATPVPETVSTYAIESAPALLDWMRDRIPRVTVHVAGAWWFEEEKRRWGGRCWPHQREIVISLTACPSIFFHEAWHVFETAISDEDRAAIDRLYERVRFRTSSRYWEDGEERRARAFQRWAWDVWEGRTPSASSPGEAVFLRLWNRGID
jgi:hypothetical protein